MCSMKIKHDDKAGFSLPSAVSKQNRNITWKHDDLCHGFLTFWVKYTPKELRKSSNSREVSLTNQPFNIYSWSTHGNQRTNSTVPLQQWHNLHQQHLFYERKSTDDLMVTIKEAEFARLNGQVIDLPPVRGSNRALSSSFEESTAGVFFRVTAKEGVLQALRSCDSSSSRAACAHSESWF